MSPDPIQPDVFAPVLASLVRFGVFAEAGVSVTVMVTTAEISLLNSAASLAVTVNGVAGSVTVGVPETTPVDVLSVSPAGRAGLTENVGAFVNPVGVMVLVVSDVPFSPDTAWLTGVRLRLKLFAT